MIYEVILYSLSDIDDKFIASTRDHREDAEKDLIYWLALAAKSDRDTVGYIRES